MVRVAKTEKVTVTLPKKLAGEIRAIATKGEVSSLVAEALEEYLARRKFKIALKKGFGAWKDEDHPELKTPEDTIAFVNAIRKENWERHLGAGNGE